MDNTKDIIGDFGSEVDDAIWCGIGENINLWYGGRSSILSPILRAEYNIRPLIKDELNGKH